MDVPRQKTGAHRNTGWTAFRFGRRRLMWFIAGAVLLPAVWLLAAAMEEGTLEVYRQHLAKRSRARIEAAETRQQGVREATAHALRGRIFAQRIALDPPRIGGRGDLIIDSPFFQPGAATPSEGASVIMVAPSTDPARDDGARINDAIASAAPPAEVRLGTGIYRLRTAIRLKSGIRLRGEGMRRTVLLCGATDAAVRMAGRREQSTIDVIEEYRADSTRFRLRDATAFRRGDLMQLDWNHLPDAPHGHPVGAFCHVARVLGVAKDSLVQIDRPLGIRMPIAALPKARVARAIVGAAVEGMTIQSDSPDGPKHLVLIEDAVDCRVSDCELSRSVFSHLWVERSASITIERNYIHHGWEYEGRGGRYGYGLCLCLGTADCLVSDNVFQSLRHAMIVQAGARHNVFLHNYSTENNPQQSKDDSADISAHGGFPYMNLFEGNDVAFAHSSDNFGSAGPLQIFFRNRIRRFGVIIGMASHCAVVAGNHLDAGALYIDEESSGAVMAANFVGGRDVQRVISSENDIARRVDHLKDTREPLIPSLYLKQRPDWPKDIAWPAFGPEMDEDVRLPARRRFEEDYRHWPACIHAHAPE